MYTGEPYSSVTGLYLFGARYYDDSIGRFITQDSYPGSKTDPMSRNRYVYARDNPERYVDHSGHVYIDENGVLYVASGTALRAAGVITTTASTTSSATIASTSTSTVVTSYISPAVVLAQSDNVAASSGDLTLQQQLNLAGVTGTSFYGGVPGSGTLPSSSGATTSGSSNTLNDQINAVGKQVYETVGPPRVTGPMIVADAAVAPIIVGAQDYVDISNGHATWQDAVNTGLVIGALIVLPVCPVVALAVLAFAGDANLFGL